MRTSSRGLPLLLTALLLTGCPARDADGTTAPVSQTADTTPATEPTKPASTPHVTPSPEVARAASARASEPATEAAPLSS
ncbi:hypothetical protein, partial [Deinococcus pimensis]|uniref:hypothetical protein n=1 Tax=Deinococcus pimensis TaxID=309888 RepID=UPI000489F69B